MKPKWAERVEAALTQQGRSSAWLADVLGIERSQMRHILRGDPRYRVDEDLKERMAKSLGVPAEWLFNEEAA